VVHGGIDGFSRLIPFLRAATDNRARTGLILFIHGVQQYSLPSRIRVDGGGEYTHIRRFMERELGQNRGTVLSGSSVHNQRIERLWRDVYIKVIDRLYKLFYHLEDYNALDVNNHVHMFCLHYVFLPRLDQALNLWATAHNNHRMRAEGNQTPLQLWYGGIVQRSGQQSTAIDNIFTYLIQGGQGDALLQELGIDWDLSDPERIVRIPIVGNPLNEENTQKLYEQYPVAAILVDSDSFGIDIYGRVLAFVELSINSQNADVEPA
jgi:hypothetical protein